MLAVTTSYAGELAWWCATRHVPSELPPVRVLEATTGYAGEPVWWCPLSSSEPAADTSFVVARAQRRQAAVVVIVGMGGLARLRVGHGAGGAPLPPQARLCRSPTGSGPCRARGPSPYHPPGLHQRSRVGI